MSAALSAPAAILGSTPSLAQAGAPTAKTVADRGHGISRESIRRLGELLFTTKGEAGTGLGLWVTYQLIEKYGGSIQVYSSARTGFNGIVFRVCFADSDLVVPDTDQSGSVKTDQRAQRRDDGPLKDDESDQSLKRA